MQVEKSRGKVQHLLTTMVGPRHRSRMVKETEKLKLSSSSLFLSDINFRMIFMFT